MARTVLFHYHLFKNAGTSLDRILRTNFPNQWVTKEFPLSPPARNRAQVAEWIEEQQDAIAFSSHTALLPPPEMDDLHVLPILFIRHPIDRIASAYEFERKQNAEGFGSVLARNTALKGYVDVRLSIPSDRQCRDFHVARLASMVSTVELDERQRALMAVDALPFVGLVESFEESIGRLAEIVRATFGSFEGCSAVAENVSRNKDLPLERRLEKIRSELGDSTYQRLLKANEGDIAVHAKVAQLFAKDK